MANGQENSNSNFCPLYWKTFKKNLLFFGVRVSFSSISGRKNIWPQDARLRLEKGQL